MIIENLKLSKEEMAIAVGDYLKLIGLNVEIEEIDSFGYPVKGWNIRLKTEVEPAKPPVVLEEVTT